MNRLVPRRGRKGIIVWGDYQVHIFARPQFAVFNKVLTFGIEEGGPQMSHPKTGHSPYTQAAGARKRNGLQLIFCHLLRIKFQSHAMESLHLLQPD
ncbi:hypothetical protein Y1Q_0003053 [Alligator mississippiensis]|uniref:Uncharacterized protein n=1 Tax=Alligator mississippiensis TaxID=8496 RepID=A0A151MDC6_ALLMI|nr:hypothetical protein Y1Q_0003053 [Alligator mississippiensis]